MNYKSNIPGMINNHAGDAVFLYSLITYCSSSRSQASS